MNNLLLPVGIAILAALNMLDLITTRRMIDSGKGFERNPVMAWLFKMLPKQLWWLPKLAFIPAVLGLWFIGWPYGTIGVCLCCVYYAAIVYNNYCIINA
jgi:hypothetical protein